MNPQDIAAKKPEMKRAKASPSEEEWMKILARKMLRKKKPKPEAKKPDWPRRTRPEAVLIKPTEGVSYAAILKDLKKHVEPDELGVTVHGIRETRSKDLLVELKCSKEGRGRLDTALKEVIGASGTVRHLIPRIEVEIADIEHALKLLKATHIKIGWFFCRVCQKIKINRCY